MDPFGSADYQDNPFAQYDSGSDMPGVPGSGGHMPTTGQLTQMMYRRRAGTQVMEFALANDKRGRALTQIASGMFAGGNKEGWMATDTGKLANLALSGMLNSSMSSIFNTGGNSQDLMAGIQRMMGSGLRVNGGAGQVGQFFAGKGALNNQASMQMFNNIQDSFYEPMGTSIMAKTQGFDRGQIGSMMAMLGERGATKGMNMGTMDAKGSVVVDDSFQKKVTELTQQALKTVRVLGDITGSTDMRQLVHETERITGSDFGIAGAASKMRVQMENLRNAAPSLGLDANEMMGRISAVGGGVRGQRAVMSGAAAYQSALEDRAASGTYLKLPDQKAYEQINVVGRTRIMQESPDIVGAMLLTQNALKGDDAVRMRAAVNAVGSAKTAGEKSLAYGALNTLAKGTGALHGLSLARYAQINGGEGEIGDKEWVEDWAGNEDSGRLGLQVRSLGITAGITQTYNGADFGGAADTVFRTMDAGSRKLMIKAFSAGNELDAKKAFDQSTGFDSAAEKKAAWDSMSGMYAAKGKTFGDDLTAMGIAIHNSDELSSLVSKGDTQLNADKAFEERLSSQTYGMDPAVTSMGAQIARGYAGVKADTKKTELFKLVGEAGRLDVTSGKVDGVRVGTMTKESAAQLKLLVGKGGAWAGGLTALGLGSGASDAEVMAAMNTSEGFRKFNDWTQAAGLITGTADDGKGKTTQRFAAPEDTELADKVNKEKRLASIHAGLSGQSMHDAAIDGRSVHGKGYAGAIGDDLAKLDPRALANSAKNKGSKGHADWVKLTREAPEVALQAIEAKIGQAKESAKTSRGGWVTAVTLGGSRVVAMGQDSTVKDLEQERKRIQGDKEQKSQEGDLVGTVRLIFPDSVLAELRKLKGKA